MSNDKYKMFLNFMHNELQITKDDIKQWVMEAVERQVEVKLKDWTEHGHLKRAMKDSIKEKASEWGLKDNILREVSRELIDEFKEFLRKRA